MPSVSMVSVIKLQSDHARLKLALDKAKENKESKETIESLEDELMEIEALLRSTKHMEITDDTNPQDKEFVESIVDDDSVSIGVEIKK